MTTASLRDPVVSSSQLSGHRRGRTRLLLAVFAGFALVLVAFGSGTAQAAPTDPTITVDGVETTGPDVNGQCDYIIHWLVSDAKGRFAMVTFEFLVDGRTFPGGSAEVDLRDDPTIDYPVPPRPAGDLEVRANLIKKNGTVIVGPASTGILPCPAPS